MALYLFDAGLEILKSYKNVEDCAKDLKLTVATLEKYIRDGSFIMFRYYVSYDRDFEPTGKRRKVNPILNRNHSPFLTSGDWNSQIPNDINEYFQTDPDLQEIPRIGGLTCGT